MGMEKRIERKENEMKEGKKKRREENGNIKERREKGEKIDRK